MNMLYLRNLATVNFCRNDAVHLKYYPDVLYLNMLYFEYIFVKCTIWVYLNTKITFILCIRQNDVYLNIKITGILYSTSNLKSLLGISRIFIYVCVYLYIQALLWMHRIFTHVHLRAKNKKLFLARLCAKIWYHREVKHNFCQKNKQGMTHSYLKYGQPAT
jgi:hypothetical protein